MVQYIHTPWRDRQELLRVRQQLYPSSPPAVPATIDDIDVSSDRASSSTEAETLLREKQQQDAVARVSMWVQRGGCPHVVESTAILTAAILGDARETRIRTDSSTYIVRSAYSTALIRFVTGLLDGHQDKQRKLSMYSIAKNIGLPATFVELRHQATHEQLPSLLRLRTAASKALVWIWDYYWKNLTTPVTAADGGIGEVNTYRKPLMGYLRDDASDDEKAKELQKQAQRWEKPGLLRTLADIVDTSVEARVILRATRLSRVILDGGFTFASVLDDVSPLTIRATMKDLKAVRADVEASRKELDGMMQVDGHDNTTIQPAEMSIQTHGETEAEAVSSAATTTATSAKGWVRHEGPWKTRPIGVV